MAKQAIYARGSSVWKIAIVGTTVRLTRDQPRTRIVAERATVEAAKQEYARRVRNLVAEGYRLKSGISVPPARGSKASASKASADKTPKKSAPLKPKPAPAPKAKLPREPREPRAPTKDPELLALRSFRGVKNKLAIPSGKRVSPTSVETLEQWENVHDIALPESYRELVLAIGGGELGGVLRIAAPGTGLALLRDLGGEPLRRALVARGNRFGVLFDHAVCFAETERGDRFVWDTGKEPARGHEYPIAFIPHDGAPQKLRGTFREVVLRAAFDGSYLKRLWRSKETLPVERTFTPS